MMKQKELKFYIFEDKLVVFKLKKSLIIRKLVLYFWW